MPSLAIPDPTLSKELEILLDFDATGTLAAKNTETSLPTSTPATPGGTNGSLGPNELAEILAEESWSPWQADGTMDDLRYKYLTLDAAADSRPWFYESGRADLNISPAAIQRYDAPGHLTFIGGGLLEATAILIQGPLPGEDATDVMGRAVAALAVPRYATSVIVTHATDVNAVTGRRHTRLWGHRFTAAQVDAFAAAYQAATGQVLAFGGQIRFRDRWANNGRGMTVSTTIPLVPVSSATWTKLPGGMGQDAPQVWPFRRFAIATQASSGSSAEYDFTYSGASGSNVASTDQYQNLDFNYAPGGSGTQATIKNILLVNGWGVRALAQSADTNQYDLTKDSVGQPPLLTQYLRIVNDTPREGHPTNGLPASNADNPQHFGWIYPNAGGKTPALFRPLRRQSGYRIAVAQRRGVIAFQDNGTSIAANQVGAAVEGLLVQNYQSVSVS